MITRRLSMMIFILFVAFQSDQAFGQQRTLLTFVVSAGDFDRFNTPVCASLNGVSFSGTWSDYQLVEISGQSRVMAPFQLDRYHNDQLWWVLSGKTPAGSKRVYELQFSPGSAEKSSAGVEVHRANGAFLIRNGGKNALQYQVEEIPAPEGKSELFQRAGFIHPLWTPKGEVLTRIQPADHIHHYGIWNPWTSATFEGRHVDFWNLAKGQGTVKVVGNPTFQSGPVFGKLTSRHVHMDLTAPDPAGAKAALDEDWQITVWNSGAENAPWLIDFRSTLYCATDSSFTINAYRYQGFSIRATEKWDDQTARLLTSEGKDKANGNGTRARWCDVRGESAFGQSGILFMTNPQNHNFPEQLRIWPTGMNQGKENVYVNFNPAQESDWILQPGNAYALNYRMAVYDGELSPETMEAMWQDYAHPPGVEILLNRTWETKTVLVYTKNGEGYVHDNIPTTIEALKKLGETQGFKVEVSDDPGDINEENLQKFHALIFSNTNNETFDTEDQKLAFQRYIQAGGGFVGIHSASGSERQWPWFWQMLGGKFRRHAPLQQFDIQVLDPYHPSTTHLPEIWNWEDECYYLNHLNPDINVLLAAQLKSVEDEQREEYPGETYGDQFPLSWSRETEMGRLWYTSLGHKKEYYSDPDFLQHLLGGILWVLDGADRLDYARATGKLITN